MAMKLTYKVDGNVAAIYGESAAEGKRAVTKGVGGATQALKANWRGQVSGTLGPRLGNTVKAAVYPQQTTSFHPAGLVWSKAGNIVSSFEEGTLIRSESGFFLAIPLPGAGSKKGVGGKRLTPRGWELRTHRRLKFIYRAGRYPLLVDDGTVDGQAPRAAFGVKQREYRGFKNRTVPIFVLVPQVKMPKKLNLAAAGEAAAGSVAGRILAEWRDEE